MPSPSEPDEVDMYLDKVTAGMDRTSSPELNAERWGTAYGVQLSVEDTEQLTLALADSEVHSMMQCIRGTLAETRSEMEQHLRMYIARLEMDGMTHDQAVQQAFVRFGDPKKLGRKIRRSVSQHCRKQSNIGSDMKKSFFDPQSWLFCLSYLSYIIISNLVPGPWTVSLFAANILGIVPFLFGMGSGIYTSRRTSSQRLTGELALLLRKKPRENATFAQKIVNLLLRLMFPAPSTSLISPSLIIEMAVILWICTMPLNSVARPMYFGMACAFTGNTLGQKIWNRFGRAKQIAE